MNEFVRLTIRNKAVKFTGSWAAAGLSGSLLALVRGPSARCSPTKCDVTGPVAPLQDASALNEMRISGPFVPLLLKLKEIRRTYDQIEAYDDAEL